MSVPETLFQLLSHHDEAMRKQGQELLRSFSGEELRETVEALPGLRRVYLDELVLDGVDLRRPRLVYGFRARGGSLRGARLDGAALDYCHFDGADLTGARLTGAHLGACSLDGANLRGACLEGARLERLSAVRADLRDASLRGVTLREGSLEGALLEGADLEGATLRQTPLSPVQLRGARLRGATLHDVRLSGLELSGIELSGVRFRETVLHRAVLDGVGLRGADLRTCSLREVSLRESDLQGACLDGVDLAGADLRGADLRGASLRGADLRGVRQEGALLGGARLEGAIRDGVPLGAGDWLDHRDLRDWGSGFHSLRGASLEAACLAGLDLRGVDLSGAWLVGANLRGADLRGADLREAVLDLANLCGADVRGARLDGARSVGTWIDAQTRLEQPLSGCIRLAPGLQLVGANVQGLDMSGADLSGAALRRCWLHRCNLRRVTLRDAKLERTALMRCDLRGAALAYMSGSAPVWQFWEAVDLRGADVRNATLPRELSCWVDARTRGQPLSAPPAGSSAVLLIGPGADLRYAHLSGIDLGGADLRGADLTGAVLQGADLRGADLREATLDGAVLEGAAADELTCWPGLAPPVASAPAAPPLLAKPPSEQERPAWMAVAASVPLWDGAWVLQERGDRVVRTRYRQRARSRLVRPAVPLLSAGLPVVDLGDSAAQDEALIRLGLEMGATPAQIVGGMRFSGRRQESGGWRWSLVFGELDEWMARAVGEALSTRPAAIAALWAEHRARVEAGAPSAGARGGSLVNPPWPPFHEPRTERNREEVASWAEDTQRRCARRAARWAICVRALGQWSEGY